MKTANSHNRTARLATVACIALLFGTIAWSQPNENDTIYWAYESGNRNEDQMIKESSSDNALEIKAEEVHKAGTEVKKINVNPIFYDIKMKQVSGIESLDRDLKRKNRLVQQYGIEKGLEMYDRNIWIGMTTKMVYESIGEPCDVYVHTDSRRDWVHWEYMLYGLYLGFENGILVSIQDI